MRFSETTIRIAGSGFGYGSFGHGPFGGSGIYLGVISHSPTISRELSDPFWGTVAVQDISFTVANANGAYLHLYQNNIIGRAVVVRRYDALSEYSSEEFAGIVSSVSITDEGVVIGCSNRASVLEEEIPKLKVDTSWPAAFLGNPAESGTGLSVGGGVAQDALNRPVPIWFGDMPKVQTLYVNENIPANKYDYLVGHGHITVVNVYRTGANNRLFLVNTAEYTVSTSLYPGYTVVRFVRRQVNTSNTLTDIFVDGQGPATRKNFVTAIRHLLTKSWGLNQVVDAVNFNAAAALVGAMTELECDGVLTESTPAMDVLKHLLMVRGMRLSLGPDGWRIAVDAASTATIRMVLNEGRAPESSPNILSVGARDRTVMDNVVTNAIISYRFDRPTSKYLFQQSQVVNATTYGAERVFENLFIREHACADRVLAYLKGRLKYGSEQVGVGLPQEARILSEGDLVMITSPRRGLFAQVMEVTQVEKSLEAVNTVLVSWDTLIYAYTAATPPADDVAGTFEDFSNVPPNPVANLTFPTGAAFRGTYNVVGVGLRAFVTVRFTTPTDGNYDHANVRFRKNLSTIWQASSVTYATGTVDVRIENLDPEVTYEYSVQTVNKFGLLSGG